MEKSIIQKSLKKAKGGTMSLQIEIPETVVQAIRLPEERISQELLIELAVSTYREGILSFG